MTVQAESSSETAAVPHYYDGPADIIGDLAVNQRYYTYPTDVGLVAGKTMSVAFTIDRPSRDVWPVFKDFNCWQGSHHCYSGIPGDLQGQRLQISNASEPGVWLGEGYDVVRVIPERTIVLSQPVVEDQVTGPIAGFQGGGISPGFHIFLLNEREGKTGVSILMQHARRTTEMGEDEALNIWRELALQSQEKWRDSFVPTLKRLIYQRT